MATSKTTLSGALSADNTKLTVAAYTAPAGRAKPLARIDDEIVLITDASLSPTLGVVRGYMGTLAVAHEVSTAVEYGTPADFPLVSKGPSLSNPTIANPTVVGNTLELTTTGTTGSTAALITVPAPAFINLTGATSSGANLPVPSAGDAYTLVNKTTGTLKIYCIGGTINGTTGTTAFDFSTTGNKLALANCATAGAWQIYGVT